MTRLLSWIAPAAVLLAALTAPAGAGAAVPRSAASAAVSSQNVPGGPVCGICPLPNDTICWETVPVKCPIPIVLTYPALQNTPVHWRTLPGTAHPGIDYVDVPDAVVVIPAGQTTVYAQVQLIPNGSGGTTRWFTVQFTAPPTVQLVRSQVRVSIIPTTTP
jgi:hypothetical protein